MQILYHIRHYCWINNVGYFLDEQRSETELWSSICNRIFSKLDLMPTCLKIIIAKKDSQKNEMDILTKIEFKNIFDIYNPIIDLYRIDLPHRNYLHSCIFCSEFAYFRVNGIIHLINSKSLMNKRKK